jgi:hypothetical protein
VTLIPERGRSDPVYAVAQVAVDPGDVSWSGPSLGPFESCCWPADSLRPFDERLQEAAQPIAGLLV